MKAGVVVSSATWPFVLARRSVWAARSSISVGMALALLGAALLSPAYAQTPATATITGQILERSAGLPVTGATVTLQRGGQVVGTTTTSSNGSFSFENVAPGDYTVQVSSSRFRPQVLRVHVVAGQAQVVLKTVLTPATTGLKTIAEVVGAGNTGLQATATINKSLSPSILQDQNYIRAGASRA
jgi:hypothetical protein